MKTKANRRVRVAVAEAGIKYIDLADTMGLYPAILSSLLAKERSEAVQDEMIAKVWETKERLEKGDQK